MANEILVRVRSSGARGRFIICPTEYCGKGETPYRQTLGQTLEPSIEVFWTGRQVCSATITAADLAPIAASLRRLPLIWDNYPVNDGAMRWDPHIRPCVAAQLTCQRRAAASWPTERSSRRRP